MYIDYLSKSRTNGMKTGREYLTAEELVAVFSFCNILAVAL